jgi:hypothetical protein
MLLGTGTKAKLGIAVYSHNFPNKNRRDAVTRSYENTYLSENKIMFFYEMKAVCNLVGLILLRLVHVSTPFHQVVGVVEVGALEGVGDSLFVAVASCC